MNRKQFATILVLISLLVAITGRCLATTVEANLTSLATIPVTASSYTAGGNDVQISLGFAPATGACLTVIKNTGPAFIDGQFTNLAQGQTVTLSYDGVPYIFVANYYGGSGNDLVLQWKVTSPSAWGSDYSGQLGNGSTNNNSFPDQVIQSGVLAGKTITTMAAGHTHSLALCSDGILAAWGCNGYGQLGNGSSGNLSSSPVLVNQSGVLAGKTIIAVAAGTDHSLTLCSDGTLAAWGRNSLGQLGNGSTSNNSSPVLVNQSGVLAGKTIIAISAGAYHNLAMCSDGTVAVWGHNYDGQLGNGSTASSLIPVLVDQTGILAGRNITSVTTGSAHSLALCSDGTLACWGYNNFGQLGNGSSGNNSSPVLVSSSGVLAGKTVTSVSAGSSHCLALCADGTVAAWGNNEHGQLGNGGGPNSLSPVLVDRTGVLAGRTIIAVTAGSSHSFALCSDGTLAAWGYNLYGQIGNGSTSDWSTPVLVNQSGVLAGKTITTVAAGGDFSLVLCSDGTLAAWGYNNSGRLGDGSSTNRSSPVLVNRAGVLAGKTITTIAAGYSHCLALCSDGTLTTWGYNSYGSRTSPVLVNQSGALAGKTISFIAAGYDYSLALCSDGTLAAWGYNSSGQLGNGSTTNSSSPVPVNQSGVLAGKTITAVSACYMHNLALCSDGTLVSWGLNNFGQLGNGAIGPGTDSATPILVNSSDVLAGKTVTAIAAGGYDSLALVASPPSTVSTLVDLSLGSGSLSPAFAPTTTSYSSAVAENVTSITVTPMVMDAYATVTVNGSPVASGTESQGIPLMAGANIVTVQASAEDGISRTTYTITVTRADSYQAWMESEFPVQADRDNPGISGCMATPANDGIANLMKYALALEPREPATSFLPATGTHNGYMTLTYRKNKQASNLRYTVEATGTLAEADWQPATSVVSVSDAGNHWLVTIQDNVPQTGHASRFMRLKIEE